ncbi:MAG: GerMN domain-containing protein [Acidimicrobiales bacterium]
MKGYQVKEHERPVKGQSGGAIRLRAWVVASVVAAVVVGSGCGVPADDGPQAIAGRDLPADLLDPNPGSSTTLPESAGTTTVDVFLLDETPDGVRLAPVSREVARANLPNERLAALFGGATQAEIEAGITSGIPADTVLLGVTTDDERQEVVIDLSDDIFTIEGEALARAFAQMVFTATEPGAGRYDDVRFSVDGEPTTVLDGDGAEQSDTVTRDDYDMLAPVR